MSGKRPLVTTTKTPAEQTPKKAKIEEKPRITVEQFYAFEDALAAEAGADALFESYLKELQKLREELSTVDKDKPCSTSALCNIAAMRRLMRLMMFNNKRLKEETAARLETMEGKYLALQNSSSEIQHLHKEIGRCLEFRSGDEDIELVPVEEFYSEAPETVCKPEVTKGDEHEQRLARLQWEMQQRKELVGTLSELEGRRAVLVSDINGKEQRLKSLKPKIDDLIKASKPLQEVLGGVKTTTVAAEAGQRALSAHLPHDLSVLYVQAEAYKDIIKDGCLSVHINGDISEASKWSKKQAEEGERAGEAEERDNDSDGEEGEGDAGKEESRQENVTQLLEANKDKLCTPHPISLQINVGCEDDVTVKMKMCYMPELRCTFLRWKISGELPRGGGVCADDVLMEELFPGDTGVECPNMVGAAKLQQLDVSVDSLTASVGRPYRFVQSLVGADGPVEGLRLADALQNTVKAIRSRVQSRISLAQQITQLESCRLWEAADAASELPSPPEKVVTEMKSCKMITEEQYLANVPKVTRELSAVEGTTAAFYMQTEFEHKPTNRQLTCYVFIGANYPKQPPLLSVSNQVAEGGVQTAQGTAWIKKLERVVNIECVSGCKPSHLLLHQLVVLCAKLDTVAAEEKAVKKEESSSLVEPEIAVKEEEEKEETKMEVQ